MNKLSWKLVTVSVVIIAAIIYILPTIDFYANERKVPTLWPKKKINLGLDLQGGMHLVLEVQSDEAVTATVDRNSAQLYSSLKGKRIIFSNHKTENGKISLWVEGEKNIEKFNDVLSKEFPNLRILSKPPPAGETTWKVEMDLPEEEVKRIKEWAWEQALETIRNRIDEFGVSEPDIRKQGVNRILIQLPGVKNPQAAKELIGRTAVLEFKLVDESPIPGEGTALPKGTKIYEQIKKDPTTNVEHKTQFLLKERTLLTGSSLTDARVRIDSSQFNEPYVSITFDKKGSRDFERITGENVNKRLAIVLDSKVQSAPSIREKIGGGQASITGSFTMEEAKNLAIALRAGSLPASVKFIEERTVGPSLGADSIEKGLMSMAIGGLLVVIFMVIYYRKAGLIADLALIMNIVLIAAGLAACQATLTLPGIAGIILTIGMAVDANVLIFERIREELALGKSPYAAVKAGYDRATLTILDANVTTLIAALVLFQFGTGPIKGFAVTLSLGVVSSLFTALILTRLIFDSSMTNRKVKTLSI